MVRVHIWLRKRDDMSTEEFLAYWIGTHAPIARDGYEHLTAYVISAVTRVPGGQEAPYDGVAELVWEDREGMATDLRSEAARRGAEDLPRFASASGLLFVEQHLVK